MGLFRSFLEQDEPVPPRRPVPDDTEGQKELPWNPKKEDLLVYWKNLQEDPRIDMEPIPKDHSGSSYLFDTIRLTGSRDFIDSILSKLKSLIALEDEEKLLKISYKETVDRDSGKPTGRYHCYIQIWDRSQS